ncbi:SRPBCC family protein [Streptomyces sp. Y7]|uniref:SRPBCC family protein n=1 Tax=Streptomyces sp. Y7 TaxID=3342392 RepID=UPI00371553F7
MIEIERTLTVNDGTGPDITVDQMWEGLIDKARNPMRYVPEITACTVTEEFDGGIVRDIINFGKPVTEVVTWYPQRLVHFVRTRGEVMGTIDNDLQVDEQGELQLTFRFRLAVRGMEPGGSEESAFAGEMAAGYLNAVRTTIRMAREKAHGAASAGTGQ